MRTKNVKASSSSSSSTSSRPCQNKMTAPDVLDITILVSEIDATIVLAFRMFSE